MYMYYVKTRADNSGYTNHRVTCLIAMVFPFDSEQVYWVSFQCLLTIKATNLKLNTLVESVDPNLLTREDNSIQHFIWVIPPFWKNIISYWEILIILKKYP
jgi:hypothetical protein